jgi:hypothetical protein
MMRRRRKGTTRTGRRERFQNVLYSVGRTVPVPVPVPVPVLVRLYLYGADGLYNVLWRHLPEQNASSGRLADD